MKNKFKQNEASIIVIAICVFVMLAMNFTGYQANDVGNELIFGAYYKPFIASGEWWRLLTAGFVHGGYIHLLVNMMALYSLGTVMENIYGKKYFLMILFGSSIGGYLFMFITQGNTLAVGLSGGLYGLMAAYIYIVVKAGGWNYPPMRKNLIEILLVNAAINFVPGIAYMVHLGGFITGALLAILFDKDQAMKQLRKNTAISLCILVAVCFKMAMGNIEVPDSERYYGTDYNYLTYQVSKGHTKYASWLAENLDHYYGANYFEMFY